MIVEHKKIEDMSREELELIIKKLMELDSMGETENPQRQAELAVEIQNLLRVPMLEVNAVMPIEALTEEQDSTPDESEEDTAEDTEAEAA